MSDTTKQDNFFYIKPQPYIRNSAIGFAVLFGVALIMLVIVSFVTEIVVNRSGFTTPVLRISTVLQDILVFIAPALLAAITVTRLPATFLRLDAKPKLWTLLLACLILVTSIPAMDWVIALNENITLPESLSGIESKLREMEDSSTVAIALLQGNGSVMDLLMSVLIIGCLTGLCEEMFFRGALQGLLFATKLKKHLAVWIAAAIFSLLHFEFFGFIPRLLLGAYFGYLIWWSGSIWIPVIVHALNNSIVVVSTWITAAASEGCDMPADNISVAEPFTIVLSAMITAVGIIILRRITMARQK